MENFIIGILTLLVTIGGWIYTALQQKEILKETRKSQIEDTQRRELIEIKKKRLINVETLLDRFTKSAQTLCNIEIQTLETIKELTTSKTFQAVEHLLLYIERNKDKKESIDSTIIEDLINREEFSNDMVNFKEKISSLTEMTVETKAETWQILEELKHLFTIGNTKISNKTGELINNVLNEFPKCNNLIGIALAFNTKKINIEEELERIADFKLTIFALRGEILHYLDSEIIFSEPIKKEYQEVE